MAEILFRLGLLAARRARTVIAVWLALLAAAGVAFAVAGGTLANSFSIPGTPTGEVTDRLQADLPAVAGGTGTVVLRTADGTPFTAVQSATISDRVAEASGIDGVETVVDPFATRAQRAEQQQQVDGGLAQLEQGRAELAQGREQLDAARAQAEAAGVLEQAAPELDQQQAALEAGAVELEAGAEQLRLAAALMEMSAEVRTVSADGSTALAIAMFTETSFDVAQETRDALMATFEAPIPGVVVDFSSDVASGVPEVFGVAEALGLVAAGLVLVIMLGTLVGAGLPILTALIGVAIGALGAMSLSGVVEMASMTPVLGIMLGLAVGIDYALFIVNRHRRQLKHGYDVDESIGLANGTSGNAVVFAGTTVLIALLALNVTGIPFLALMGTVGAMCVAIAVLIAVTLTPALLSLAGTRILSRRERAALVAQQADAATASAVPTVPGRRMSTTGAVVRVLGGVAGLVLVALPAVDLRLGLPDGSSEAQDTTQYRAYTTVSEQFGAGQTGPLLVVADLPGSPTEAESLAYQVQVAEQLFAQDDVLAVVPVATSEDRTVAAFQVVPAEGPTTESTELLVTTLRELSPLDGGITLGVAGQASGNIDISDRLADVLPAYLGVVVGLSLLILVIVFRSLLVPAIATAGFVLSYFAALGGVVAIYQWGWFGAVFGVDNPGPVLSFLPTLLVGILFGLAMDYMLFIGSGMRESYVHGVPARLAVAQGVHAGRAVVTAAAIIMASVFGGFVFAHSAMIRPVGFSLALGVLLDAFVVRMLVVPGFMHLVGDAAWWLPRWLDRLLPDVDVEGAKLERRHPHHVPEAGGAATGDPDRRDPAGTGTHG
ncbi:MMPL family transporter [Cellulomonas sp. KRMCY2]|uniref:MMPL family transporter n=1 Tax=Cellulomonas sp. KRMCY2 TaxID=1304865 RepID=UPI00045E8CF0|nr:MMPL family transporter [Cellulomonas sp. KRMCY2]